MIIKHNKLMFDSTMAILIRILGAFLSFYFSISVTNQLGLEESGKFFYAFSLILLFSSIFSFGLNNSALKLISINTNNKYFGRIRTIIFKSISIVLFVSIFCGLIILVQEKYTNIFNIGDMLYLVVLCSTLLALVVLLSHSIQGMGKVKLSMIFFGPMSMFITLIFMYLNTSLDALNIIYLYIYSLLIVLCFLLFFVFINTNSKKRLPFDTSEITSIAKPLFIVVVISQLNEQIGSILLGLYSTPDQISYFSVSNKIALLVSFVLVAVNRVFAPRYSSLHNEGNISELKKIVMITSRFFILLSIPIILFFVFFSENILELFGNEYVQSKSILLILVIGQVINLVTGSVGTLLQMTGHERSIRNNIIISFTFSTIVGLVLIPSLGAYGAAIMTSLSLSLTNVLSWYSVLSKLKINTLKVL